MNDDAKYFFFLSGFMGFIFFYVFSLVLNHDPLKSLLYGSIGSVFLSLSWRIIFCSALKKVQCARQSDVGMNVGKSSNSNDASNQSEDSLNSDLVTSSAKANMEASSTRKSLTSVGNSLKQ